MLSPEQSRGWERDGYVILSGFADSTVCDAMHARAVGLARESGGAGPVGSSVVQPETRANPAAREAEDGVSKIFKLHRDEPDFRSFVEGEDVQRVVAELIGPSFDCFLSQFIFKNVGAMGQPWHQDSFYFRFDRSPQIGLWLAVTEATLANGCLRVLPGSHREPVHEHVPDRRPSANFGYVEIADHDMSAAVPVEMAPGDLLVFHSHLMHRSTDNESAGLRAAMVYHFAEAGTVDRDATPVPINDWMPIRRHVTTQVDIDAPVERVWSVLVDGTRYGEWNPYLVKIEGVIETGADIVAHGQGMDGRSMTMPVRVVSAERPSMHWEGGLPDRTLFKGDHFFELEDLGGDRTRLHHHETFTGSLVGEIVDAGRDVIHANFERMNDAARRRCESG